jgi:non-ribosomal peptide synthetase component E (peptide arylation enzyme)
MAYVNMMPAELAVKYTREKLWLQKTVFDILAEHAAAHPDRIAIKDQHGVITYSALKDRIERAAQFYRSIGIKRGDVVTIQLPCARARVHAEIFGQLGLRLPKGVEGFRLRWYGARLATSKSGAEAAYRRRRCGGRDA